MKRQAQLLNQGGIVCWLTGLSGAGKTTIAKAVFDDLTAHGYYAIHLDGDHIRQGLCKGLGFAEKDRTENIRRTAEVAKILADNEAIVICSLISPTQEDRKMAREISGTNFFEVYIETALEECIKRDVKGLYQKALAGEIENFTGISAPYEAPLRADITLNTSQKDIDENAKDLYSFIEQQIRKK